MPKTLLLADDSITIQKVVGITFAGEDFKITAVDNGDEAVARARELKPDVILADVVMPRKNGYEVCEAIKSDPTLRHIPVLLLAGTFEAFDDARARAVHADGHIAKPFESQALINKVKELVGGAAAQPSASTPRPQPAAASAPPVSPARMSLGVTPAPVAGAPAFPPAAARPGPATAGAPPSAVRPPVPATSPRPGVPLTPAGAAPSPRGAPFPGFPPRPPGGMPPPPGFRPSAGALAGMPRPPIPVAPRPGVRPPSPTVPSAASGPRAPMGPPMPAARPTPAPQPTPAAAAKPAPATTGPTPTGGRSAWRDPFGLDVSEPRSPSAEPPGSGRAAAPTLPASPVAPAPRQSEPALELDWSDLDVTEEEAPDRAAQQGLSGAETTPEAPPITASMDELDFADDSPLQAMAPARPAPALDVVELPELEPEEELGLVPTSGSVPRPEAPRVPAAPAPSAEARAPAGSADGGEAQLRDALSRASREVIERIAWEVVPELAEVIIREQIDRLVKERQRS